MRGAFARGMVALILSAASVVCCGPPEGNQDGPYWPHWRGPDGNGISVETAWSAEKLSSADYAWKVPVGVGFSGVSVVGDRVYTMGNVSGPDGETDQILCLDARTGKRIWKYAYPCAQGTYPGPKTTPTVDAGRVYTLSQAGDLLCLDAARGRLVWQRNLTSDFGAIKPISDFACSPVVWEDLLLLNAGVSGMAVNRSTGELVWGSPGRGAYASVVPFETQGTKLIAVFGQRALYAVDPRTGSVAWSYPWDTYDGVNAADPLVVGDSLFISSNYGTGCALLRVWPDRAQLLWKSAGVASHFSSFLYLNGSIFANDGDANARRGAFVCLDAATGEERWRKRYGVGSLLAVGGSLFLLGERGKLWIAEATSSDYQELAFRAFPSQDQYWTPPVFCRGKLYVRSTVMVYCLDLGF